MNLRHILSAVVCVFATTIIVTSSATATTIHVSPGELISTALAGAASGDTVLVHCGTYAEQGLQMVDGVTLRSETGEADCVTIASVGLDPIITCDDLLATTLIEGITFGVVGDSLQTDVRRGAGLLIRNSGPQISRCAFRSLSADYGGAIYCGAGSTPTISQSTFVGNTARAVGGAINCVASSPYVVSSLFVGNTAAVGGAALNAATGSQPNVITCTLDDNSSQNDYSAFTAWNDGKITVINTIVVGEVWNGDGGSLPDVTCSDFYTEYGNPWAGPLADQADINGNIFAEPRFCGDAGEGASYALDATSPCAIGAPGGCGQMGAFPVGCALSGVIDDQNLPERHLVTGLAGNYPNPFNPSTTIRYNLQKDGAVKIAIYDIAGRLVTMLLDDTSPAGSHEIQWHGIDQNNRSCAAGVYFVQLSTDLVRDTSRLSLIK